MIRSSTLIWLGFALLFAMATFQVKHQVQILDSGITALQRQVREDRDAIALLHAEWAYLNRPDRLAAMARRHLNLRPVLPNQLTYLEALPDVLSVPVARAPAQTPRGTTVAVPAAPRGGGR